MQHSYSKTEAINLLLYRPGCRNSVPFQPQEHHNTDAWLLVSSVPLHPKCCWTGSRSVKLSAIENISLTELCAKGHCCVETGKGQTQTVETKLETRYCLKYHYMLYDFPSLEPRDPEEPLKKKTDEKLHWTTASEIWTYSVSSGRTNPVQLLSGSALSPALSQTKQRQPPDSTLLRLTFSQGGRFLQRGVNEGDVARTSHRGVCCVRRAADGENDRKQLLGLFQENDSHSPLLSQVV